MLPALKECHSQDSGRLREHPLDEAAAQAAAPLGSRGRWQRAHDVGDDATARDGCLDQGVQLLVTADGELQVARGDALDLKRKREEEIWMERRLSFRFVRALRF